MFRYTVEGLSFSVFSGAELAAAASGPAVLELTLPDTSPQVLSYLYAETGGEGNSTLIAGIDSAATSISISGMRIEQPVSVDVLDDPDVRIFVESILFGEGFATEPTTVLSFTIDDSVEGTVDFVSFLFFLDGAPLPDLEVEDTLASFLFNTLTDAATSQVVTDGAFAPGQPIGLTELPAVAVSAISTAASSGGDTGGGDPGGGDTGGGTEQPAGLTLLGTNGDDTLIGGDGPDLVSGLSGNDRIEGGGGDDTLRGGDGLDTVIGGDGDDIIFGGASAADLRDNIFGGAGNDTIDGGHGNDELRGDAGNDVLRGGFGVDSLFGGAGDDNINGGAFSDLVFGGAGNDFVNGGFGFDRINGGAGADTFFHLGIEDHGSDWIQDFAHAEGDVLLFGQAVATGADFQVNIATTQGAGDAGVDEAFVVYKPTGQIVWALVDGAANPSLNLSVTGSDAVFDLLA